MGWIVSPRWDLLALVGPPILAGLVALVLPESLDLGLAGWLSLVVVLDVGHVWVSLWRTWLDPQAPERERFAGSALFALVACALVMALQPGLFWPGLAGVAVFHFVRQQAGVAAIYRGRAGVPAGSWDSRVEDAAVHALCLFPLLWWCTHLPRDFAWFIQGDFPRLPAWLLPPAAVLAGGLVAAHLALRLRSRRAHWGRDLWFAGTALCWFGGIVLRNGDAPFTVANVVSHGLPYFALVHAGGRRPGGPPWPGLLAFLGLPIALALGEELLWDVFVWQEHGPWQVDGFAAVASPLLAVPQLTHYLMDGYIWKRRVRGVLA